MNFSNKCIEAFFELGRNALPEGTHICESYLYNPIQKTYTFQAFHPELGACHLTLEEGYANLYHETRELL